MRTHTYTSKYTLHRFDAYLFYSGTATKVSDICTDDNGKVGDHDKDGWYPDVTIISTTKETTDMVHISLSVQDVGVW